MKRSILFLSLFAATFSSAQLFDDLDAILAATNNDAQTLSQAFIAPLGQSLTYSLNSGWANSAKTHKKFGFDITVGVVSPSVSDEAKSFNINALNLQELESDFTTASTVFGADSNTTFYYELQLPDNSTIRQNVELPGGLGDDLIMNSLPTPYLQVGLGLLFDTDIIVRYIPNVENEGAEFGLFGIGLKHSLTQYLGLVDKLPLNISALAAYSKMNVEYELSSANPDQMVAYDISTFTLQALASLDFPIISLVGGFGYGKGDVNFDMLGDYTISLVDGTSKSLNNPISFENSYTGTNAMIGVRANLAFIKLFANYTLQEFNTLNAGVSFSFR
ncbi:MAG: hypothetical protein GWO82_04190 [Bacteroidetes bacterium]|nr:hypothetical protein [Bacteroidota bacterium]